MAKKNSTTKVESIRHKDKRTNIPTEELRDFVTEEEQAPGTMLYPRDPSLDPQLVWKGKDEQDQKDLAVPVVPIYIQEKIHPQAIIDALPRIEKGGDFQPALWADFNGGPQEFEQKIDFYHHEQNWTNRLILGDSLLVMTSLAEKEGLKGKVQTIYLDPPYGIKFGSNWQVSTRKRDVKDGKAEDATRQPEQVRAFRDTWQLGIHSYLAYLRDRLVSARELLTETGSIFVQIGDENVHLVRSVMDEVFGSENCCSLITFRKKTMPLGSDYFEQVSDYILWYAKSIDHVKTRPLYRDMSVEGDPLWSWAQMTDGSRRKLTSEEINNHRLLPKGARVYRLVSMLPAQYRQNQDFAFEFEGKKYPPPKASCWKTDHDGMKKMAAANRLQAAGNGLQQILLQDDYPVSRFTSLWADTGGASDKWYVVQTTTTAIERCLIASTDPGDLVLDPTCGSGTTAYVAEQWGRRWITCDTSRVALALARTRLMGAKYSYYLLADSPEGAAKERMLSPLVHERSVGGTSREVSTPRPVDGAAKQEIGDIKKGFVYKRVPHVTLKSIANNPDIQEGMTREAIDAAIARHAETETLFDQPYEDNKRVRVCGPFWVESLSPHRTISVDEKRQRAEHFKHGRNLQVIGPDDFGHMILENLRKAGVQNTRKNERLKFETLEPYAGEWIHGVGAYMESSPQISQMDADLKSGFTKSAKSAKSADETSAVMKRAAICIGPEHGTVGAMLIKEAAKEAVKGVGFDLLIVCGFAFDPTVSEESKRYGKLTVLPTKMNPDLAMGDELLKKTGAGNLFMVFGEPDVEIRRLAPASTRGKAGETGKKPQHRVDAAAKQEQIEVEIKGLDVYDPTTGQIRNSSTDDIACWFIDTNYNGESFFVRHAYFTGAEEPYDKLKRALRAEINEDAWSSLYQTVSRPFSLPETGKIAVKVINHYGDEVLKVFEVS